MNPFDQLASVEEGNSLQIDKVYKFLLLKEKLNDKFYAITKDSYEPDSISFGYESPIFNSFKIKIGLNQSYIYKSVSVREPLDGIPIEEGHSIEYGAILLWSGDHDQLFEAIKCHIEDVYEDEEFRIYDEGDPELIDGIEI